MADLEEMSLAYRRLHGRRVRVATKYMNLARRFFAQKGVTGYRIVESLGATEGTPAAGLAELIVDITTTGATLKANGLKVLDDGVILQIAGQPDGLQGRALDARAAARWRPRSPPGCEASDASAGAHDCVSCRWRALACSRSQAQVAAI